MKSFIHKIAIAVLPSILIGCKTLPEEVGRTASDGDGKAVISVGALPEGTRQFNYTAYSLSWRAVNGTQSGTVTYGPRYRSLPANAFPFRDDEGVGIVHMLSLKPGDYEIYNYALQTYRPGVIETFSARHPFSLRFSVRSNEITYVGRFLAESFGRKNFLGFEMGNGGFYYWLSREDSDLGIVSQEMQDIAALPRVTAALSGADVRGAIKYLGKDTVSP